MVSQKSINIAKNVTKKEEMIDIISAYFLIIKYPTLGNYIQDSFNSDNHEELIDFLFSLEMEDEPQVH